MTDENITNGSRIIYVDPADAYTAKNSDGKDVNIIPPLEDMCISFDLYVETFPRRRTSMSESANTKDGAQTSILSWYCKNDSMSMMQGNNFGANSNGVNFLTTYYTDICYDNYGGQNFNSSQQIVEGLGVENVSINFESWVCPTVTIKFIDVRGSAIFGNEDKLHENENKITAENIFGSFMTLPYPRFRLQVKGFLGRPVTFQLTVSSFNGEFNSQNGNFEIVVKFIGYTYALLGDVPFEYLLVAPYSTYVGAEYWNKHASEDASWKLSDGSNPPRLQEIIDIVDDINREINENDANKTTINAVDSAIIDRCNTEIDALNGIKTSYNDFLKELTNTQTGAKFYIQSTNDEGEKQYVFFFDNNEMDTKNHKTLSDKLRETYGVFYGRVQDYNASYTTTKIDKEGLPNEWDDKLITSLSYKFQRNLIISRDASKKITDITLQRTVQSKKTQINANDYYSAWSQFKLSETNLSFDEWIDEYVKKTKYIDYDVTALKEIHESIENQSINADDGFELVELSGETTLKNFNFNQGDSVRHLNDINAKTLYELITKKEESRLGEHVYVLDVHHIETIVDERIKTINDTKKGVQSNNEQRIAYEILQRIKFKPCIGDIFKIIMCHLETFVHMYMRLANDILTQANNGQRSPDVLGLTMGETDVIPGKFTIKGKEVIPPWPLVLNFQVDDIEKLTIAWIGEKSHNFLEENMVLGIERGIDKINVTANLNTTQNTYSHIPLLINDLITPPYYNLRHETDFDITVGHIVTRAMNLLGVRFRDNTLSDDCLKVLAKLDAYNFVTVAKTPAELKPMIFDKLDNKPFEDVVIGIAQCSEEFKSFERQNTDGSNGHYNFEVNKRTEKKRDPIIEPVGDNYEYRRWPVKIGDNTIYLMPTDMKAFEMYGLENFEWKGTSCIPLFNNVDDKQFAKEWVSPTNTTTIISENSDMKKENVNSELLYKIVTDPNEIASIKRWYDDLKENTSLISNNIEVETDFDESQLQSIFCDFKRDKKYFKNSNFLTSKTVIEEKIPPYMRLTNAVEPKTDENYASNIMDLHSIYGQCNKEGVWTCDGQNREIDDMLPLLMLCNRNGQRCSLFGSRYYYDIGEVLRDKLTSEELYGVRNKGRALAFLHTFGYNYNVTLNCFKKTNDKTLIDICPYGYLLFLGGLLWRDRIIDKFKEDPMRSTYYRRPENGYKYTYMGTFHKNSYKGNRLYVVSRTSTKTDAVKENDYIYCAQYFGYTNIEAEKLNGNEWKPDVVLSNKLVDLFEKFVANEWRTIRETYELHNAKNEKKDASGGEYIDLKTFEEDYRSLYNNAFNGKDKPKINKTTYIGMVNDKFRGWSKTYDVVRPTKDSGVYLLCKTDVPTHQLVKDIFLKPVMLISGCSNVLRETVKSTVGASDKISVSKSRLKTYLQSFASTLKTFSDKFENIEDTVVTDEEGNATSTNPKRDTRIGVYTTLKTIWDKWILSAEETEYNVSNFFNKNFIFIDSFYLNTYDKLLINLQELRDIIKGSDRTKSVYTVLDNIVAKHRCVFMAVPDYVGFTEDQKANVDKMHDLFRPLPYNSMPSWENNNKFVVIYTYGNASISQGNTNFQSDTFDIWSEKEGLDAAPSVFKITQSNKEEISKYGYHVPSFGISFGSQYNQIFKQIKVNMNNPVVTDVSAFIMEQIVEQGRDGSRKGCFCGQDLYSIHSNYAYECEFEMMGNAQIVPLMYFQLLNVPMWRGTYMIYSVSHSISPGNMTTRVKGTRMSSRAIPFVKTIYRLPEEGWYGDGSSMGMGAIGGIYDGAVLQSSYTKVSEPTNDYYAQNTYQTSSHPEQNTSGTVNINASLRKLFNILVDEIKLLDVNKDKNQGKGEWSIRCTSAVRRETKDNEKSAHYSGNAIDLHIIKFDSSGNVSTCMRNDTEQPQLFTVLDILSKNHRDVTGRVLIEYKEQATMYRGDAKRLMMLHVESQSNTEPCRQTFTPWIMCGEGGSYRSINKNDTDKSINATFLHTIPSSFKSMASVDYKNNKSTFTTKYPNFINYSSDVLEEYFNTHGGLNGSCPTYNENNVESIFGFNYLLTSNNETGNKSDIIDAVKQFYNKTQINPNLLFMVFYMESTMKKDAANSAGSARGLFQLTQSSLSDLQKRVLPKYTDILHDGEKSINSLSSLSIAGQIRYATLFYLSATQMQSNAIKGQDINHPAVLEAINGASANAIALRTSRTLDTKVNSKAINGSSNGTLKDYLDFFLKRKSDALNNSGLSSEDKRMIGAFS